MTRKDYSLIADAFSDALRSTALEPVDPVLHSVHFGVACAAVKVAHVLAQNNERFNRDRFLTACGLTPDIFRRVLSSFLARAQ